MPLTLNQAFQSLRQSGIRSFQPYEAQREFYALGAKYPARCLSGANRVGKTMAGAMEVAYHVTGEYPDWWEGKRFDAPNTWWCGSTDWATNVEGIQKALIGDVGKGQLGEGFIHPRLNIFVPCAIPKANIHKLVAYQGVANAKAEIVVRHISGGFSRIRMISYSKGRENLQAGGIDGVLCDEEPPEDVFDELTLRTFESGGLVILTFTPLKGISAVVRSFIGDVTIDDDFPKVLTSKAGAMRRIPMSEAPHITDEMIEQLKGRTQEATHGARIEGIPGLGEGAIYPFPESKLVIPRFEIPTHWRVLDAIDFGWRHPTARVRMYMNPDSKEMYLDTVYKQSEMTPQMHMKEWTRIFKGRVPVVWPHDGENTETDGTQKLAKYTALGMYATTDSAQLPSGGNSLEGGIDLVWEAMYFDKFKVFPGNHKFFSELSLYRRERRKPTAARPQIENINAEIVKDFDDILDAVRYCVCGLLSGQGATVATAFSYRADGTRPDQDRNIYDFDPSAA